MCFFFCPFRGIHHAFLLLSLLRDNSCVFVRFEGRNLIFPLLLRGIHHVFLLLSLLGSGPEGDDVLKYRGVNFPYVCLNKRASE